MADKPANHYTSSHVSTPRWDPPNFAYSTPGFANVSSNPGHSSGITGKQEGYSSVTKVLGAEIGFTGSNAGASALFLPVAPVPATAGSASFADGTSISLGDLPQDQMLPFNIASVSASTATVLVFKR
jgi:hypothetical protein